MKMTIKKTVAKILDVIFKVLLAIFGILVIGMLCHLFYRDFPYSLYGLLGSFLLFPVVFGFGKLIIWVQENKN